MGNRVKQLMINRGLDVHKLAKRSGISRVRLSAIMLQSESGVDEDEIQRLAIALEVDRSAIETGNEVTDNRIDGSIRWHLEMIGRMDLLDQVRDDLHSEIRGYRHRDSYPLGDDVILGLIHSILDNEDPGA